MPVITLHHNAILRPDTVVHLTRTTLTPARPKALHNHDFFELFWVQNGQVRHHMANSKEILREGDLVFVRPEHAHALQGKGEAAMVVSLCLHPELVSRLQDQHPQLRGRFFWTDGTEPDRAHRNIRQMATLNAAALQLERSSGDQLSAQAFLLPLLSDLLPRIDVPHTAPQWLHDAVQAAHEPAVFRGGAAGLVALTGHSHPHVSRATQHFLGQSPSTLINQIRMGHAARLLTTDSDPLAEIAKDCGIPNLSHFHKLFRAHHGLTPLAFRQQFQRDVVQPK